MFTTDEQIQILRASLRNVQNISSAYASFESVETF